MYEAPKGYSLVFGCLMGIEKSQSAKTFNDMNNGTSSEIIAGGAMSLLNEIDMLQPSLRSSALQSKFNKKLVFLIYSDSHQFNELSRLSNYLESAGVPVSIKSEKEILSIVMNPTVTRA